MVAMSFYELFDLLLVHSSSFICTKALLDWGDADSMGDDVAVPV